MKYLVLQNTIAPYRISLFNKLKDLGLDIELLYMCEVERGRSWEIDYKKIHYLFQLEKGPLFSFRGHDIYLTPTFLSRFIKEKDVKIIMGSPWNYLDVVLSCILKRIGLIKAEIIFWSEANNLTNGARRKSRFRDWLRSFVYSTGEGRVIIPGRMASKTFGEWGFNGKKFITLPNVIEEEKFEHIANQKRCFTSMNELPNFVIPARLLESVKGQMNFFDSIGADNIRKARFILLGDGEDEARIREYIIRNDYQENIVLGGFRSMEEMAMEYMNADCLLLPSFSDPSPLSLVEGCFCQMPLLVSNRCGNHYETVNHGVNGFVFDPGDTDSIRTAFEGMMARRADWPKMGEESRRLFERYFAQDKVLRRFVMELADI